MNAVDSSDSQKGTFPTFYNVYFATKVFFLCRIVVLAGLLRDPWLPPLQHLCFSQTSTFILHAIQHSNVMSIPLLLISADQQDAIPAAEVSKNSDELLAAFSPVKITIKFALQAI